MVARRVPHSFRLAPFMPLVTCEHGGNRIPSPYRRFFKGYGAILASHRGYDRGALALAKELAETCQAPLIAATVSRLLVELNRSAHHRKLFSEVTRGLAATVKARMIADHYAPYRAELERRVREGIAARRCVFHVSSHSFTPILDGAVRHTDVGILYDPRRCPERQLCEQWSALLAKRIAPLRVRRNYPYRGYDDGLTTYLRRLFAETSYLGVEIEVNQKHVDGGQHWRVLRSNIVQSFADLLAQHGTRPRPE